MTLTAEMRFWWRGDESRVLRTWLERLDFELSDAQIRKDIYFDTDDPRTGIKLRGGEKPEVKKQKGEGTFRSGRGEYYSFNIWEKRGLAKQTAPSACNVGIGKRRWLAFLDEKGCRTGHLDQPENGCQIEVSQIQMEDSPEIWTSFCLEAYGEKRKLKPLLQLAVDQLGERPAIFHHAVQASYPEWLSGFCSE